MIARRSAALALLAAPVVIVAALVGYCVLATTSGCFLWNQEPVCPPSKPACLNDHDPVIWQPHGPGTAGSADAGSADAGDTSDTRDARRD